MNLRDCGLTLRGNMVGRVGVEPTTKRLRVSRLFAILPANSSVFSLSRYLKTGKETPCFVDPLRDPAPHNLRPSRRTIAWTQPDRLVTGDGRCL